MNLDLNSKILNCADILVDCTAFAHPDSDHLGDTGVDGSFGFSGKTFVLQCKSFPTAANPLAVTGQQFAELEHNRAALSKQAKVQAYTVRSSLEYLLFISHALEQGDIEPPQQGTAAYLRELRKQIVEKFNAYLRTLYVLRRVTQCLTGIRKIFFIEFRPFQGFDWSKRAWSLLHGSHPPKTSVHSAVVGCGSVFSPHPPVNFHRPTEGFHEKRFCCRRAHARRLHVRSTCCGTAGLRCAHRSPFHPRPKTPRNTDRPALLGSGPCRCCAPGVEEGPMIELGIFLKFGNLSTMAIMKLDTAIIVTIGTIAFQALLK